MRFIYVIDFRKEKISEDDTLAELYNTGQIQDS